MKLVSPTPATEFAAQTIYGKPIHLSDYKENALVLYFLRDTSCTLCLKRIVELTVNFESWKNDGIEILVVFNESSNRLRRFFAKHPLPFPVIADPNFLLCEKYGVERREGGSRG